MDLGYIYVVGLETRVTYRRLKGKKEQISEITKEASNLPGVWKIQGEKSDSTTPAIKNPINWVTVRASDFSSVFSDTPHHFALGKILVTEYDSAAQ